MKIHKHTAYITLFLATLCLFIISTAHAEDEFEQDEALMFEDDDPYEEPLDGDDSEEAIHKREEAMARQFLSRKLESRGGQGMLRILERRFPEAKEHLLRQVEKDPIEAREIFERLRELVGQYRELARENPAEAEMFVQHQRMEMVSHKLAAQIHRAHEAERYGVDVKPGKIEALEDKLRETLTELLELKLEYQQIELEELENEVEELSRLLEFREQNKDKIVEKRMNEILGEHDPLEW